MSEFVVQTSDGSLGSPLVTALADGNFVVTWAANSGIVAQIYSADGQTIGGQFSLESTTTGNQGSAKVTPLADGGFFATWTSNDGLGGDTSSNGIRGRIFNADGTADAGDFLVNTTYNGNQSNAIVTELADGRIVVAWQSQDLAGSDTSGAGIRARIFDADGTPAGDDFVVNTVTTGAQNSPEITALSDGGYIIAWMSADLSGADTDTTAIRSTRYDADGNVVGTADFEVNTTTAGRQGNVRIAELADGRYIATWGSDDGGDGDSAAIRARIFEADGTPAGDDFIVNTTGEGIQGLPSVTLLEDGRIFMVWGSDETQPVIRGRLLEADGTPAGDDFIVNTTMTGTITTPTVATLANGDVAVSWVASNWSEIETITTVFGTVLDFSPNEAPTDIALSNTTVSESARIGSAVGTLSAVDPDGDAITWSLVAGQGDNNAFFDLKTNEDGSVSVVLKNPLDFEGSQAVNGVYELVVRATDSEGNYTDRTIEIQSVDDPFKLSSAPTGKTYTSVVESAEVGQEIGYVMQFDASFVPKSATLTDDADGLFAIASRQVNGVTQYYLTVNGKLDHETAGLHSVTIAATDANGVTKEKTFEVHVLDAPEATDAGLTARGTITIDAGTALAKSNGGVNWDAYIDQAFAKITPGLPGFLPIGSGWSPDNPSSEFLYANTTDGTLVSLKGSDLLYNWSDPISGEDAHVVSGTIESMSFGNGVMDGTTNELNDPELTISGLDLFNDSGLMNRIMGETQLFAQAWMYGADGTSPADVEFIKAILSSYAQHFIGSGGNDTYSGTLFGDTVEGKKGADRLNGGAGNDTVDGGKGKDVLKGGGGDDIIDGGKGIDRLYGGGNADTFVFEKGDTGKARAKADTIFDFKPNQGDIIDLSGWDANSKKAGDQDFDFIGSQNFHGKAGELRFVKETSDTWIMGDTNGDKKADFMIHLDDAMKLKVDHFDL